MGPYNPGPVCSLVGGMRDEKWRFHGDFVVVVVVVVLKWIFKAISHKHCSGIDM